MGSIPRVAYVIRLTLLCLHEVFMTKKSVSTPSWITFVRSAKCLGSWSRCHSVGETIWSDSDSSSEIGRFRISILSFFDHRNSTNHHYRIHILVHHEKTTILNRILIALGKFPLVCKPQPHPL